MGIRIWNFDFRAKMSRNWSTVNQQPKQVRFLKEITRSYPIHKQTYFKDANFYQAGYLQDTRRPRDRYTTSYFECDAFERGHEGVTWPLGGNRDNFSCWLYWEHNYFISYLIELYVSTQSGSVRVAHHVFDGVSKEAMLLSSSLVNSSSKYAILQKINLK
jgi:hypothetical protein